MQLEKQPVKKVIQSLNMPPLAVISSLSSLSKLHFIQLE